MVWNLKTIRTSIFSIKPKYFGKTKNTYLEGVPTQPATPLLHFTFSPAHHTTYTQTNFPPQQHHTPTARTRAYTAPIWRLGRCIVI